MSWKVPLQTDGVAAFLERSRLPIADGQKRLVAVLLQDLPSSFPPNMPVNGFRRLLSLRGNCICVGSMAWRWTADVDWESGEGVTVLWRIPFVMLCRLARELIGV